VIRPGTLVRFAKSHRLAALRAHPTRWVALDGALYAAAALFAGYTFASASFVDVHTWAACAWPAYALAATIAVGVCATGARLGARRLTQLRMLLAALVLAGALALPLGLEVGWRLTRGSEYAASEVLVTEEAAAAFLHRRNPYAVHFGSRDLAWRTPSIAEHFPYLPGMALAGVPHALAPHRPWTDARLSFAVITAIAAAFALACWRAPPDPRLTALQVLVLLPTGAALLATGGDDVPVLALSLLALVLLEERRPRAAVGAAAAAAALKLTAWPLLFAVLVVSWQRGRVEGGRLRTALPVAGVVLLTLGAAALGPASFADDVVLFPLGLTPSPTPAASHTLGQLLLSPFGDLPAVSPARLGLIVSLLALAVCVGGLLLLRLARSANLARPGAAAAIAAAGASLAVILLAPTGRSGYLIYPLELAIWAALLRRPPRVKLGSEPHRLALVTDTGGELQPTG
jgi:Glycosyltransferase family 87